MEAPPGGCRTRLPASGNTLAVPMPLVGTLSLARARASASNGENEIIAADDTCGTVMEEESARPAPTASAYVSRGASANTAIQNASSFQ